MRRGLGSISSGATGAIRQFIPEPREFVSLGGKLLAYYLRGIFRGAPHPLERSPERKLHPLQQATYLAILNVLLPLQIATGILIWGAKAVPSLREAGAGDGPRGMAFRASRRLPRGDEQPK